MPARQRSNAWRRRVTRERRHLEHNPELAVCWLCGDPIDMELPSDHDRAFSSTTSSQSAEEETKHEAKHDQRTGNATAVEATEDQR